MTTKIIIPNEYFSNAFAESVQSVDIDLNSRSQNISNAYVSLFENTEHESQSFFISDGLISSGELQRYNSKIERLESEKKSNSPRVLESLGTILVDDLSQEDEVVISSRATIYENFDINMIQPEESINSDDGINWHLDTLWGDSTPKYRGKSTRIGVMDTGIDASHPEFAGKNISFMEFDRSGFAISTKARDAGTHGTHVCGIAAGKTCGVAPDADLAVAAVLTTNTPSGMSGTLAQILAGYNWLIHSNHASNPNSISMCDVINASLGGRGFHPYLYSSVNTVFQLNRCLLIAAIGNNGRAGADNHGSPGNYDNVIGVGATNPNDIVTDFSDWGQEKNSGAYKPDLSAPGDMIRSAVPGGGYAYKSGTSMAAPMVAGAAALAIQKNPQWNFARKPKNLEKHLLNAVSKVTNNAPRNNSHPPTYSRIGTGRLDLSKI